MRLERAETFSHPVGRRGGRKTAKNSGSQPEFAIAPGRFSEWVFPFIRTLLE
jgi:hypothetical protein